MAYAIGIDLGGTKIEAILAGSKGKIYKRKRVPTEDHKGAGQIIDKIVALVEELSKGRKILGVGIGVPSYIDRKTHRLHNPPNNPKLKGVKLGMILKRRIRYPLFIENDANCLALSEVMFGAAKEYKDVVGVILGSGFGGGIVIDRKLLSGATPNAGEIGHMKLVIDGRKCGCGIKGCIEAYASGTGIEKRYMDAAKLKKRIKVQKIIALARKGNRKARKIMDDTYEYLAIGFANIVNILDPEAFVLGGGVSNIREIYKEVPKRMRRHTLGPSDVRILKARLGDSSGVLGAASLVFSAEK